MSVNISEYWFETEQDQERLMTQHNAMREAMGGRLVLAPIDLTRKDLRILDSATSNGYWLGDLQRLHPHLDGLVGVDLDNSRFPKNLPKGIKLFEQDILKPWPAEWARSFDLVNQKLALTCSIGSPQPYVNALLELVKPGGWVQLQEADNHPGEDGGPAMTQMYDIIKALCKMRGFDGFFSRLMKGWLEEAGFIKIGTMTVPYFTGAACQNPPYREGTIAATLSVTGMLKEGGKMIPGLNIPHEELDQLPDRMKKELETQGGYYPMTLVWGQRPVNS